MAVDPEWLRRLQEQALMGAQQSPTSFNPEMMAANAPMPNPQFEGAGLGGMLRRGAIGFQNGLGRVQQAMFPIDSTQAAGMSAEDIKAARNQAMMKMGLGMMGAAGQGAGGGEALAHGYGLAQGGMNDQLQQRMQNARVQQQDQRQVERDQLGDDRYTQEFAYQQELDRARMEMEKQAQAAAQERFNANLDLDKRGLGLREREIGMRTGLGRAPSGYQWKPDGTQQFIPGGPADPSNKTGNFQEAERTAAFLGTRLGNALKTLRGISDEDQTPGLLESAAKGIGSEMGANMLRSGDRQKANAAQRDALDAALTLATGAAYTSEQIDAMRVSYFPQIGDDDATKELKRQMLEELLQAARTKSGRASSAIDEAMRAGASGSWKIEEIQ